MQVSFISFYLASIFLQISTMFVSGWLLSLILCWGLPSPQTILSSAAVYFVTPRSPNSDCPLGDPCLTLNEYAQGNLFEGDDDITLHFLSGEHNLTSQIFEMQNKKSFEMAPNGIQDKVVIHLLNRTDIRIQHVAKVKLSKLKLISQHEESDNCTVSQVSISGVDLLLATRISLESCNLSLEGQIAALIAEFISTEKSSIRLLADQHTQTVTIKNSTLNFSTLSIRDISSGESLSNDTATTENTWNVQSSLFRNSFLTANLQANSVYRLSVSNSSITSLVKGCSGTGIKVETFKRAAIYLVIVNNSIIGNSQGINISTYDNSHVELSVDQCYIASNGYKTDIPGGIEVFHPNRSLCNSRTIITVTSTTLSGNTYAQIGIFGYSGTTVVTVFNSTIRDTCDLQGLDESYGPVNAGAHFEVGNGYTCYGSFINLTQNIFENNTIAAYIVGENCTYEAHFIDNHFASSYGTVTTNGALAIRTDSKESFVTIKQCNFTQNKAAAIFINSASILITIIDTIIAQNANGIIIEFTPLFSKDVCIIINDSIFQENNGISLGVEALQPVGTKKVDISLNSIMFFSNTNILPNGGIIQVDGRIRLSVEDSCVFRANHGSSIQALTTNVTLSGGVIFEDNTASQGGAISLSYSVLRFQLRNGTKTTILFINNTATNTGGGIYIAQSLSIDPDSGSACFYDEIDGMLFHDIVSDNQNITLVFINNTAANGGKDLYGATPNSFCHVTLYKLNIWNTQSIVSSYIYKYIFKHSSDLSSLASDPKRVCLCKSLSQLMCANLSYIFYNTTRYPGEVFILSLVVVGFEFATVTGPIYASLLPQANDSNSSLGRDQYVRQVTYDKCNQLEFTINSLSSKETIVLTANNTKVTKQDHSTVINNKINSYLDNLEHMIPYTLLTVPVYIDVTLLLDCPPGFKLYTETGRCDCITALKNIGINNCSINNNTMYITRSGNQWIKPAPTHKVIFYSKYCPFNYCKHTPINLNLNDPDMQCALDHTGILCGACSGEFSLAIGSSRCLKCSDGYHTLLLIAFAAAGVSLVVFIKILDLTVSTGTISGLIFYANIVWANQSVLFPPQTQTSSTLQFLKVFVAWLNLDLGIETCFFQGLDGYWKTWLQFVFPAYTWLMVGTIILVSHYSTTATKIFGNNSVSVLATLFLLSYAKLLRTILIILEFTLLQSPNSSTLVWSFDGNIPYLGIKHSFLFVVAIAILLVFWLPYTFVLLFIKCLRRHSHYRLLRWVNRLKPLFDSYLGPLKVKHHYWIGLGLLARLVLLLISAVTLTTVPYLAAVLITLTAFFFGMFVLDLYKQWFLSVLEACFLFNLSLFCCGSMLIELLRWSKDILACISLGTAFILFLVITGYNIKRRIHSLRKQQRINRNGYECIDNIQVAPHGPSEGSAVTYQVVSITDQNNSPLESPVIDSS